MIKKEITFIYKDPVQKQVFELISEEAHRRGYLTKITDDIFAKCEIGWYCEHMNFPQFSKFSVIMLHDITQTYGLWPDIWIQEPWHKYDIGFLPSKVWEDNWKQSSQYFYANPRKGVFLTGWPKADRIALYQDEQKKKELAYQLNIDLNKPSVLYAPSWENDGKQDDFVQSMLNLDVNILIKQAPLSDAYPEQKANILAMYELHKDNNRVIQLEPQTNILDAIQLADVLVSEESSTMCEAVMMGKPAVSVSNWLIPDTTPSRYPLDTYDYVVRTKKEELTDCVQNILENYSDFRDFSVKYSQEHFSNIGCCIPLMFDVLDSIISGKADSDCKVEPVPRTSLTIRRFIKYLILTFKREVVFNYCERIGILRWLYSIYKTMEKK